MKVHELIAFLSHQEPGREVGLHLRYGGAGGRGPENAIWIASYGFMSVVPVAEGVTPAETAPTDFVVLVGEV